MRRTKADQLKDDSADDQMKDDIMNDQGEDDDKGNLKGVGANVAPEDSYRS
jgi:hypothetical protein